MTINYTTLLGLAKPVTGTESGTWGDVVNDQITSLVEDAIANAASLNVTSGNVTLTDNNGSSDQARMAILLVTGTPGVSRNIVAPSTSKWYIVKNGSNAEVVLKGSATTGVTIPAGVEALAFWNGSDFELVSMVGPSSSTDNAITRYDGTTGKVVQNSGVTIDDSNNMTGVVALTTTGVVTVPAGSAAAPAITTTGDTNTGIFFPAADTIAFSEGGTESMRIDASGNLGIGVTPSAWSAGQGFQMKNGGAIASQGASFSVAANAYFASGTGWTYTTTSTATRYDQTSGAHQWFNAPSGTAGNAITFTQAMTLTASGNLGIGATSPSGKLDVEGSGGTFRVGSAGDSISFTKGGTNYIGTSTAGGQLLFQTGASSDRMIIDSSGNVGIGNNSPSAWSGAVPRALQFGSNAAVNAGAALYLTCNGFYNGTNWIYQNTDLASYYIQNAGTHQWYTATSGTAGNTISFSERARITSGGDLLVNATTTSGYFDGKLNVAGRIHSKSNEGTGRVQYIWNTATTGDNGFIEFATEGTYTARGSIVYNRTSGLTQYNTTSDYRAKEIFGPVENSGATIDALKVYTGKMKGATQSRPMLVAHEAQEHVPYAVSGVKDEVNEDGTPKFQQMDVSSLVPLLIAEIQSLRARVAALESKGA